MGRQEHLQFVLDVRDDLAVKEVDGPLSLRGILLGVRHHHDGRALGVEFFQEVHHLLAVLGVQVTGRFIGEDQLRAGDDRAGDGDELAVFDIKGNTIEGRGLDLLRPEDLGKVGNSYHRNCFQYRIPAFANIKPYLLKYIFTIVYEKHAGVKTVKDFTKV